MKWAALIAWIVTAGGGFWLLAVWLARGGMRQTRAGGRLIRTPVISSHFLLAAAGLVIWIIYLVKDKDALAWVALAILAAVALLGFTMFAIWYQQRAHGALVGGSSATSAPAGAGPATTTCRPAEQHFPVAIVTLHGLLAVTTVVLVLLTALKVGGS
jgi:hypothetical protein